MAWARDRCLNVFEYTVDGGGLQAQYSRGAVRSGNKTHSAHSFLLINKECAECDADVEPAYSLGIPTYWLPPVVHSVGLSGMTIRRAEVPVKEQTERFRLIMQPAVPIDPTTTTSERSYRRLLPEICTTFVLVSRAGARHQSGQQFGRMCI